MSHKQKVKSGIKQAIEKWRPVLFLGEWYIDVVYPSEPHEESHMHDALASISVNNVYMQAQISIYPSFFRAPPKIREFAIVHELCHCHTQPLWDMSSDLLHGNLVTHKQTQEACEKLTQRIANIVFWRESCPRKSK